MRGIRALWIWRDLYRGTRLSGESGYSPMAQSTYVSKPISDTSGGHLRRSQWHTRSPTRDAGAVARGLECSGSRQQGPPSIRRLALVLVIVAAASGAMAASAFAWGASYGGAYYAPGGDDHSAWDNCVYYNGEIGDNIFWKNDTRLGRSAVILTDGSWVASAEDSNAYTIAYTNPNYINYTKKGYIKNTSSVTYSGSGEVDGNILCT